ncbi:hypothetical protein BX616_005536, partial [Lobosporangium transversale]
MDYHGIGVPQGYSKALERYLKAANQGRTSAQSNIGCIYFEGNGASKGCSKDIAWFYKAAKQGDTIGQYNLDTG